MKDKIAAAFHKHRSPTPTVIEMRRKASIVFNNQYEAHELVATMSVVGTLPLDIQDQYIQKAIDRYKPPNMVRDLMIEVAETMRDTPQPFVDLAGTLTPELEFVTAKLPWGEHFYELIRHDCKQMLNRHDRMLAGAFVYTSTLSGHEQDTFIQTATQTITDRNHALITIGNIAAAVARMTKWNQPFDSKYELIKAASALETEIENHNALRDPIPHQQTTRDFAVKTVRRTLADHFESIITNDEPDPIQNRRARFWQEVIDNLPNEI